MKRLLSIAVLALATGQAFGQAISVYPPAPSAQALYASTCNVIVSTTTPTSTFCPVGTDPNSVTRRTYQANSLTVGRAFRLDGGGNYTVPTGNLNTADIKVFVGATAVVNLTTPAAPVGTNQGVDFHALCTVRTSTTINCQGVFAFVVAGTASVLAPFNSTQTFDPTVANLIDVTGDWNNSAGALTTQSTTVSQAILTALN